MGSRYDEHGIKQEIDFIYITKDHKKFVDLEDAIKHQKKITRKYVAPCYKSSSALAYLISYIHHLVTRGHIQ
jgi:hypothetical protein